MPTVVLTGATRGIGQAAALELASQGADLVLVGRDAERVRETERAAAATGGGGQVSGHVADLARMDEVRRLAGELLESCPRIDVLCHNAGALFSSRHETADGFEQTIALNHLAPFLLTALLRERLLESKARVVVTSSDAHKRGRLAVDDLERLGSGSGRYRPARAYATSKLCNVLFTRELQRRSPELVANCFHPGVIRSGFGKNDGVLTRLSMTVAGLFMSSPETGAKTLVWLALDPAAADFHGAYLEKGWPTEPSSLAEDDALAAALWERSAALTGAPA